MARNMYTIHSVTPVLPVCGYNVHQPVRQERSKFAHFRNSANYWFFTHFQGPETSRSPPHFKSLQRLQGTLWHRPTQQQTSPRPHFHLVEISQGLVIGHRHLGKLQPLLRADAHDVAQQEDVVGCEAHHLRVQEDILELPHLHETLDHLPVACQQSWPRCHLISVNVWSV